VSRPHRAVHPEPPLGKPGQAGDGAAHGAAGAAAGSKPSGGSRGGGWRGQSRIMMPLWRSQPPVVFC